VVATTPWNTWHPMSRTSRILFTEWEYIQDKSINSNPNNIKDLEGVGKAVWEFLSSIYNFHWDGLYVDKANTTFRNKIKSKFTPQVPKSTNNNKGKKIVKPTLISSIPPPIPAKLQKEKSVMIQCPKCLSKELTLVLSDTRELDRVPSTE